VCSSVPLISPHPWGISETHSILRSKQDAVRRLQAVGKPAGILAPREADARRYIEWGFGFVAVGSDLGLLVKGADDLAKSFQPATSD
jgi:2-keto-3-deoxy-L-rhamnonate aldolase RhmA